ncbi:MAG TPA: cytochrome P450 [Waterburya sp.]
MKLPNGPWQHPFLQNRTLHKMWDWLDTYQWIVHPVEWYETYAQRYGDPFSWGGINYPTEIYFSHPEAIQQIFTADPNLFVCGGGNRVFQPLLGNNSLLLLDGTQHQHQRQLLTPPFHGERMRTYGKQICDITEQVISQWQIGKPFCVRAFMQEISLRVILGVVFGLKEGQRLEKLRQLLSSMLDSISSPLTSSVLFFRSLQKDYGEWSPWGRFLRLKQEIKELLDAEIQSRRYTESRHSRHQSHALSEDILSLLVSARDDKGQPMTQAEIHDELMTLLFAGHETTASALAWALYWINLVPEVKDRLLKELNTLAPNSDSSEIARLPYLTAVCQETLRIYPIALTTFPRFLTSPFEVMGYKLEPGTALFPCIYLTHRREELYPEPKRFKPERFLERQFSPYEYLPFGGGNRRCIGLAFAQFEMKLVLATILSRFQLSLVNRHSVKPVRRGVTVAPPSSMRMVVTQLQSS